IRPVEIDPRHTLLDFLGADERRQCHGNVRQQVPLALAVALLLLDGFPLFLDPGFPGSLPRAATTFQGAIGKHMGMAGKKLAHYAIDDGGKIKKPVLLGDTGVEHHLKKQVPQLLAEVAHVAALDGVHHLVDLFQGVGYQRAKILLAVPGTTADRIPQTGHQIQKIVDTVTFVGAHQPFACSIRRSTSITLGMLRSRVISRRRSSMLLTSSWMVASALPSRTSPELSAAMDNPWRSMVVVMSLNNPERS